MEHGEFVDHLQPIILPFLKRIVGEIECVEIHKILQVLGLPEMLDIVFGEVELPQRNKVDQSAQLSDFVEGQVQDAQMFEFGQALAGLDLIVGEVEFAQFQSVQPTDLLQQILGEVQDAQRFVVLQALDGSDFVGVEFEHSQGLVLAEVRDRRNAVVAEIQGIEVVGQFLDVKHMGKLIVGGFDGGKELEAAEVLESIESVEGKVHVLQIFVLFDFLYRCGSTCMAGRRLWVQMKSRKAKVVPQVVLPKLDRCCEKSSCCSLHEGSSTRE